MKSELNGFWKGTKQLFLTPKERPDHESESSLRVASAAGNNFLHLVYSWNYKADIHEGMLLLGPWENGGDAAAAWVDSYHQRNAIMYLQGRVDESDRINVKGSYEVSTGPEWGWRITVGYDGKNTLEITMYNIWPEGKEELGVRAVYNRSEK